MIDNKNKYRESTDEVLMKLLGEGIIPAFDELYNRYSKRLLYYFFRMLGADEDKAQDFLQDIFLKLVEKSALFDPVKNFSSWIFTIAFNMCKNEYRNKKVRDIFDKNFDLDSFSSHSLNEPFLAEKKLDQEFFKNAILSELDKFDENQCSTFLLKYQENFTIKEISNILGCSEGTTKSRLFYTTKKLANQLQVFNPNKLRV